MKTTPIDPNDILISDGKRRHAARRERWLPAGVKSVRCYACAVGEEDDSIPAYFSLNLDYLIYSGDPLDPCNTQIELGIRKMKRQNLVAIKIGIQEGHAWVLAENATACA